MRAVLPLRMDVGVTAGAVVVPHEFFRRNVVAGRRPC